MMHLARACEVISECCSITMNINNQLPFDYIRLFYKPNFFHSYAAYE